MSPARVEPFRIAIIGGGIGGLYAALAIHQNCPDHQIEINIYEQAKRYSDVGAGIVVGISAARLLHKIGLGEQLNSIGADLTGWITSFRRFDNGGEILTVPGYASATKVVKSTPVLRSEFLTMLLNAIKERGAATVHNAKRCVEVVDNGDHETVRFEDGTTVDADFVIGCDGIHSAVRSKSITTEEEYTGVVVYRGLIDTDLIKDWWPLENYSSCWLGKDKHFVTMPIGAGNKYMNYGALVVKPEWGLKDAKESWTAKGTKEEIAEDFKDFNEIVRRVIAAGPEGPGKWLLNDREPLSKWVFDGGKVVILGDAAHAMVPHEGAGAGQAIEDGYILSRAMQDFFNSTTTSTEPSATTTTPTFEQWLNLFQAVRLPRTQKAQRTARETGELYELRTKELKDLPVEECFEKLKGLLRGRAKYLAIADLDEAYETARKEFVGGGEVKEVESNGVVAVEGLMAAKPTGEVDMS